MQFWELLKIITSISGLANATELPFMEIEDGHYVGYWTATDVVAGGAKLGR